MKRVLILIYILSISHIYGNPCDNISIERNFFNDEIIGFYLSSIDLESVGKGSESARKLFRTDSIDYFKFINYRWP